MAHSLILGGIRSGKSSLAERLVSEQSDPVVYVATATAVHEALQAEGKESELRILDAFEDNGHDLFQELLPEYWVLIKDFLGNKL